MSPEEDISGIPEGDPGPSGLQDVEVIRDENYIVIPTRGSDILHSPKRRSGRRKR